jgi:hypothetical protein
MIQRKTLVFWAGLLGAGVFITVAVWGGVRLEGYSVLRQYISESYATGVEGATPIRYGFIASGIFMALFAFLAPKTLPKSTGIKGAFWGFGVFYGLGTCITGLFPCDMGCNPELVNPSIAQLIHNLSASLTYMFAPFCVLAIGVMARNWPDGKKLSAVSLACAVVAGIFVLILFSHLQSEIKGSYQRIIESSLLVWIIFLAFFIRNRPS